MLAGWYSWVNVAIIMSKRDQGWKWDFQEWEVGMIIPKVELNDAAGKVSNFSIWCCSENIIQQTCTFRVDFAFSATFVGSEVYC